ncbi:BrnT family toxin [Candidatus Symbiobacter mobilis]|uniref:BrnT family toxin n=1 Tax=Candidatus Symbiobacter mobilis TaxID=1436290 RepID=UPI00059D500E|nr:BrnT family toxin [Candidatus Symbiobacter mobilis]
MTYEWDEHKATANLSKHGVSFEEAKTVFDDPLYVDFYDPDHSYGEHRFILLGQSKQGRLLFVSYMERNGSIRLISAREATPSERRAYEQN